MSHHRPLIRCSSFTFVSTKFVGGTIIFVLKRTYIILLFILVMTQWGFGEERHQRKELASFGTLDLFSVGLKLIA
jgi:hypothetical protein